MDYELYVSPRLAGSTTVESGTAELGGANPLTRQLSFESLIANTPYSCYYVVTTPGGEATGRLGTIHTATLKYEHFSSYFQRRRRYSFQARD